VTLLPDGADRPAASAAGTVGTSLARPGHLLGFQLVPWTYPPRVRGAGCSAGCSLGRACGPRAPRSRALFRGKPWSSPNADIRWQSSGRRRRRPSVQRRSAPSADRRSQALGDRSTFATWGPISAVVEPHDEARGCRSVAPAGRSTETARSRRSLEKLLPRRMRRTHPSVCLDRARRQHDVGGQPSRTRPDCRRRTTDTRHFGAARETLGRQEKRAVGRLSRSADHTGDGRDQNGQRTTRAITASKVGSPNTARREWSPTTYCPRPNEAPLQAGHQLQVTP